MENRDRFIYSGLKVRVSSVVRNAGIFSRGSHTFPFSWEPSGILTERKGIPSWERAMDNKFYPPLREYADGVGTVDIEFFRDHKDYLSAFIGEVLQGSLLYALSTRPYITKVEDIIFTTTRLLEWFIWRWREMPVFCELFTHAVVDTNKEVEIKVYCNYLCLYKVFICRCWSTKVIDVKSIEVIQPRPRIKEGKEISNEENAHKSRFKRKRIGC